MKNPPPKPSVQGIQIRPATPDDARSVLSLFQEHLRELGYVPDPRLDRDMADFPAHYRDEGGAFLVAVDAQDRIIGMAGLREAEVRRVHVRQECRARGIARDLLRMLLNLAQEGSLPSVTAVIARDNLPSRHLFESCGFHATGRRATSPEANHCEVFECDLPPRDTVHAAVSP